MNIFRNQYNESENEEDWGWFITLDLDVNPSTTNPPNRTNPPTTNPRTTKNPPIPIYDYDTNKKTDSIRKNICDFYKNLLIYGLIYSCMQVDYLYKYIITPYSCCKQKC